jgi:hypothetical protein
LKEKDPTFDRGRVGVWKDSYRGNHHPGVDGTTQIRSLSKPNACSEGFSFFELRQIRNLHEGRASKLDSERLEKALSLADSKQCLPKLLRELAPVLLAGLVPFVIFALIIAGAAFNLVAWQPPILQTTQFGTLLSDNGVTAIGSGREGLYAAGFVGYTNATPTYLFLTKYDFSGHEVWSRHFDNPYLSEVFGLSVGTAVVFIAGLSNHTSYVRAYDFDGNRVSNNQFGNWSATSVSAAPPLNFYLGGSNRTAYFVRNYLLNGTLVWTQHFDNPSGVVGGINLQSNTDGVYVSSPGSLRKLDVKGNLLWTQTCTCDDPRITRDSTSVYLAGTRQIAPLTFEGFLSKYDPSGNQLWSVSLSAPGFDTIKRVDISGDISGAYLTATTIKGGGLVVKFDASGNKIWSFQLPWITGGPVSQRDNVAVQEAGVYVGGEIPTSQGSNAFVTQVDRSSSLIFFGVNPPFSFLVLTVLVAVSVVGIFWFRRRWRRIRRPPNPGGLQRSHKIPTDMSRRPGVTCREMLAFTV